LSKKDEELVVSRAEREKSFKIQPQREGTGDGR
jgi:hypothetical protein